MLSLSSLLLLLSIKYYFGVSFALDRSSKFADGSLLQNWQEMLKYRLSAQKNSNESPLLADSSIEEGFISDYLSKLL